MKKELLCGLSAALLLVSLSACSPQADRPNEPDHTPLATQTLAPSMEPSKAVSVRSTDSPTETVTPEPSPVLEESAGPNPVEIHNITLSDVVITGEYETALKLFGADGSPAAYEFLYNLGDVGFWQDTIEEYGYSTFWCYLLPENATITFHATQEMPRCDINVYTLEEVNGWSPFGRGWQATFIDGFNSTLEPGKSEDDYSITKKFIEGYDPKFDLLEIIIGNESILIWFGGPSAPAAPPSNAVATP